MKEMSLLQEKIAAAQSTADGWVPKVSDETRDLVCGLLIKCADISNVVSTVQISKEDRVTDSTFRHASTLVLLSCGCTDGRTR